MADSTKDLPIEAIYLPTKAISYSITRHIADMTPEAAQANTAMAQAQAAAVDSQYGVPSRQETVRTVAIVLGVIGLAGLAAAILPVEALPAIITTAIVTLGGAWTATTVADKFKRLPPKSD